MPKRYADLTLRIFGQPPGQGGSPLGNCLQIADAPDHASRQSFVLLTPDREAVNKIARLGTVGDELRQFGQALFAQVFEPQQFGPLYHDARGRYDADPEVGLRVQVISQDMGPVAQDRPGGSLQQVPWEYLYDPAADRFLALDVDSLSLVRSSANVGACIPLPTTPPVRMLTVLADAKVGGGPKYRIDAEQERQLIEQAARQAGLNVAISGVGAPPAGADLVITHLHRVCDNQGQPQRASRTALKNALREHPRPHIIHFCCHGSFDPVTQEGQLVLEKNAPPGEQGHRDPLAARELKTWLSDLAPDLRLVVFNACSTAPMRNVEAFKSVAEAAVQAGVAAVVAMQFDVPIAVAADFTRSFNEHLFRGCLKEHQPIDLALARAREDIAARLEECNPHWGIPVLYRHPSGVEPFQQVPAGQWQVARDLIDELLFHQQERARLQQTAQRYAEGLEPGWLLAKQEQVEQSIQELMDRLQALVEQCPG